MSAAMQIVALIFAEIIFFALALIDKLESI